MGFVITFQDFVGRSTPSPGIEVRLWVTPTGEHRKHHLAFASSFPAAVLRVPRGAEKVEARLIDLTPSDIANDQHFDVALFINTPSDLLERLEVARAGAEEVTLDLDLRLTVYALHDAGKSDNGFTRRFVGSFNRFYNRPYDMEGHQGVIPRDGWLRLLSEIGFCDVLVVELPRRFAGQADAVSLATARALLEEARRSYDENRTAHTLGDAYRALEALAPGQGQTVERIMAAHFANEPAIVRTRIKEALIKLLPVVHLGRHAGQEVDEKQIEITRQHAAFVLGTASLIVGWCAAARAS